MSRIPKRELNRVKWTNHGVSKSSKAMRGSQYFWTSIVTLAAASFLVNYFMLLAFKLLLAVATSKIVQSKFSAQLVTLRTQHVLTVSTWKSANSDQSLAATDHHFARLYFCS